MLAEQGRRVLLVDIDPQANLSTMCLAEERLEQLWPDAPDHPLTVFGCVRPILRGIGDIHQPHVEEIVSGLGLVAGDLALSSFEDKLSDAWPRALDRDEAAFRTLSAFHRVTRSAAATYLADIAFLDVGPNLGAINRAALLAADFDLPSGSMQPLGYVLMQSGMRLSRPVKAYDRWVRRMPTEFHRSVLRDSETPATTDDDPFCLGIMRHYQSLMPLAQDAQKPMFQLRPGDGAIGAHMGAVQRCRADFEQLTAKIIARAAAQLDAV